MASGMFKDSELEAVNTIINYYQDDIITDSFYPVVFTMSSFKNKLKTIELNSSGGMNNAILLRISGLKNLLELKPMAMKLVLQNYWV